MYVCTCHGIRSRQVESAIEAGAQSPKRVLAELGHTPQCGRCLCEIRDRLRRRRAGVSPMSAD